MNKVEQGNFQLGSVHYDYWSGMASVLLNTPAHVVAKDFELRDPDGNLVIAASGAEVDAYLRELITSLAEYASTRQFHLNLHFAHARVPTAYAVIAPLRSSLDKPKPIINVLAAFSPRVVAPPGDGEFRITVEDVTLEHCDFGIGFLGPDGAAELVGQGPRRARRGRALVLVAREPFDRGGAVLLLQGRAAARTDGELRLGTYTFPLEDVNAIEFGSSPGNRQDLEFRAAVKSFGAPARIRGVITAAFSKEPGIELKLDFEHGQKLLALLPAPLGSWLSGDPRGTVGVHGSFAHVVIDGEALDAAALVEGVQVTELGSKFKLDAGQLTLEPSGKVAEGAVSAKVDVGLKAPAWWRATVNLRGVNPGALPKLGKAAQAELAGRLDASASSRAASPSTPIASRSRSSTPHSSASTRAGCRARSRSPASTSCRRRSTHQGLSVRGEGLDVEATGTIDPKTQALDGAVRVDSRAARTGLPPPACPTPCASARRT